MSVCDFLDKKNQQVPFYAYLLDKALIVFLIDFHTTLALMSSAVREQGLGKVFRKKI